MYLVREQYRRSVLIWLLLCALMVIIMVAIGGITRLTHSGLSMASWKPVTGFIPPRSEAEWLVFFELYQKTPEYLKINRGISLMEFKDIFWWEFIHRVWGRLIGLAVFIPFIYFLIRRALSLRMSMRVVWLLLLGGFQGVIGWIMVKSGMVDAPYVQPVNLGIHLVAALVIYIFLIWYILDLWQKRLSHVQERVNGRFAALTLLLMVMIFTGALVAGLKAGFIFNTWPMMGDVWMPATIGTMGGFWEDISSNPVSAQFFHRWLAIVVLVAVLVTVYSVKDYVLYQNWRWWVVIFMAGLQVLLGVATLLLVVPVTLGVAHQIGAVFLLTTILSLWHGLSRDY